MWQVAAAAQYLRWALHSRRPSGTQSSGTGMARIGRASAGLGARLMSTWVWVWVRRSVMLSGAPAREAEGREPDGSVCGSALPLACEQSVNSPLKIGAEGRRRILALGNEEIGVGRCRGAHRSAHRRRCRKRSGGGRFGDTSSSLGRGRGRGWDCNRSFVYVYDSGSGCLGAGPDSDGAGRLWGFQRCRACSPGRLWSGWICSHGLRGVRFGDRGRFRDGIQTYRRIASHARR